MRRREGEKGGREGKGIQDQVEKPEQSAQSIYLLLYALLP